MRDDDTSFEERLALGWQALSPRPGAVERVRALLPASAPAGEAPLRGGQKTSGWRALEAMSGLGIGGGGLLLGLGFVAGWLSHREWAAPLQLRGASEPVADGPRASDVAQRAPAVAQAQAPQTRAPAASSDPPTSMPAPKAPGELTRPRSTSGSQQPAQATRTTNAADRELALIQRAERAVRAKNGELALALSEELDAEYPSTKFHEERQAIALMARCQRGSPDRSVERERFRQRYPSSVYSSRIALECDAGAPSIAASSSRE